MPSDYLSGSAPKTKENRVSVRLYWLRHEKASAWAFAFLIAVTAVFFAEYSFAQAATQPALIMPGNPGGSNRQAQPNDAQLLPAVPTILTAPTSELLFVPVTPCRIADTRNANGPFGGPIVGANTTRGFVVSNSACSIPATAQAFSLNVTVVPKGPLGFLTMFPCGQAQPLASTLNSIDGRIKAAAAIIPAGASGDVCAFVTNDTDLILDINGYFVPAAANATALAFYPVAPCRLVDTRLAAGPLGGPSLASAAARTFPILSSPCNVPATAQAYSLNYTSVPKGSLGFLTTWPAGQTQPLVSTLNALTGTITANGAIVPAGTKGDISVFVTNSSDLVIDIDGYFALPGPGGLSFFPLTPCRVMDTRNPGGSSPFNGTINVNVVASGCGAPASAQSFVLNSTVVPPGLLGFLTLWSQGVPQPLVSTLNAIDGTITSNMAIVPSTNGQVSAFGSNPTHLILDISGYFAPPPVAPTITSVSVSCSAATVLVGQINQCNATVQGTGNFDPSVAWSVNGIAGGNSTVGTVSGTGIYTAPANVPTPASVSVAASSVADASKSGSQAVAVTLNITVNPSNPSIQIFHAQQFTATVTGVSNSAVQWSINGIAGGNSTLGVIDSAGFYKAPIAVPAPATIQVQATSVADSSRSAIAQAMITPDTIAPQVIAVTPTNLATNVSLQPVIQIAFDARMDPSSLPTGFGLLQGTTSIPFTVGYDPANNLVTLSPQGVLAPANTYTLTVAGTVKDQSGNPMSVPFSTSFTTTNSTLVPSAIVPLPGVDPTAMSVISLQGQNATPAADGTFSASVRPQGTTALAAMVPGESFGLFAISIGNSAGAAPVTKSTARMVGNTVVYSSQWQISASPALAQLPQPVVLDFQTTAESLLFMSPVLFHGDVAKAQQIMTAIAAEPKTAAVATALQAAWNTPFPVRDPNFVTAYGDALNAILTTLGQAPPPLAPVAPQNALAPAIAAPSGAAVYHSFDVCCINVGSLALQGSSYVAPINVKGPSLQQPLGNAAGWLVRIVQLPANVDPSLIAPGTDAKGNVDSPPATTNELTDPVVSTIWLPGKSLLQYTDILGQLNNFLSGFLNSLAGFTTSDVTSISLPQPAPGTSTSYLVRAYSGGAGDLNEYNMIATLPDGRNFWIRARLANYVAAVFDEVNALGIVPSGVLSCLSQAAVQDQVTNVLVDPSSTSFIGGADVWSGFISANVVILDDFKNNFFGCAVSTATGSVFEILKDLGKLAAKVVVILQGLSSVSSAGHAIQIVVEMEKTDSPVDTAYMTLTNNAIAGSAGITITPLSPAIGAGGQQLFSFVAKDALGNIIPNPSVVWNSSNTAIAAVDNSGLATGIAPGQARITVTATETGASASTLLTVTAPMLDHLVMSPASSTLHVAQTAQFSVFGVSNAGTPIALGPVTWSTNPAAGIVSVNTTGLVTAQQAGSAFVIAESGGKAVAAIVAVIAATPSQVIVTPTNATINVGSSLQLSAKAVDSSGNAISGVTLAWGLNSPAGVVTVDSNGLVQAVAAGEATVKATAANLIGLSSMTVLVAGSQLSLSGSAVCSSGSAHVELQWNNINAASYDIYRENIVVVPNIISTSWSLFGNLTPATVYDYFLKAHMPGGGMVNSNIARVAVPATCPGAAGLINVVPKAWNPVFTVGNAPATLGFQITNAGSGIINGAITANPIGGAWLTVNGHTTSNWVAPEGESVTADPTGLTPGVYNGTLVVSSTGATNSPVTVPVTMTIYPPMQITTTTLPVAFSNQPYTTTLSATGGSGTGFVWSLQSGTLPLGLTLNTTTGVISGTPGDISGSSVSTFNIGLQDSAGHFTFKTLSITEQQSLSIFTFAPSSFQFIVGTTYGNGNSITYQAAGGTPPFSWSATTLPTGLTINASTGEITGTPTQPGTFQSHITVNDSQNMTATLATPLMAVTTRLRIISGDSPPNLVAGTVGTAYSQIVNAVGGSNSGYTWSVVGTLPPGLTSGNSAGCPSFCGLLISGTPAQAGIFTFTAVVTDSLSITAQQSLTIVVNTPGTPPQISTAPLTLAVIGQPFSLNLAATGGTAPYTWSLIGPSPDPALQLSSAGLISGTPTLPNDCPSGPGLWTNIAPPVFFQVLLTDSVGQSNVRQVCLPSYFPDPQITGLTPPNVTVDGQTHVITVNGVNFRNNAFVTIGGSVSTAFVSSSAITFTLIPAIGGAFGLSGGGLVGEGALSLVVVQPYGHTTPPFNLFIFDPAPTVTSVSAVLNNSTNPCTTNLNCQLIINGGGLVYVTSYKIVETNTNLIRADNPATPIPWNTVTTSAFFVTTPGTYTVSVTNPNQQVGGSATVIGHFTVSQ